MNRFHTHFSGVSIVGVEWVNAGWVKYFSLIVWCTIGSTLAQIRYKKDTSWKNFLALDYGIGGGKLEELKLT